VREAESSAQFETSIYKSKCPSSRAEEQLWRAFNVTLNIEGK